MKAVLWTGFGPPDVLQLMEVERPAPKEDEVLIRVAAASINSWDKELMEGKAQITLGGRLRPKFRVLGCDVAGRVEAVGGSVKRFKPGDEVFGDISGSGWGAFAEYVCAKEAVLALKSQMMSFAQAAATPQAGSMALEGLRDKGMIGPGQRVLINGAGGGVGTFAVQIAKSYGAKVTGVDGASKLDMLLSIGADHVIDYAKEDFASSGLKYDVIIDVVSNRSVFEYRRALSPGGRCVIIGGKARAALGALFLGSWILGDRKVKLLLHRPDPNDLVSINRLFEAGKVRQIIDRVYSLEETADAFRYYLQGGVRGKIVIVVE
ncbi:MAG TPA: NAD(P)-dependent alcohol dehydrogenase [Methanomassiliicoccales archaeon]|nr:NAD(P)-dependent alcohol dehydrogenase [Methanomassiliicoccales archaeon]